MSAQSNLTFQQEVWNLFSNNQFEAVLERVTDDVEVVFVPAGQTFQGREGFRQFMVGFKSAFPNMKIKITNQIATEDQAVGEFVAVGTHTGPLMTPAGEIPATGKTVELTVCEVWRIRNGKLASLHNYQDMGTLMRQLGLMN
jgi:steroid delta-isomerase-like uncharacterized protein